jgi:hypothetical protein
MVHKGDTLMASEIKIISQARDGKGTPKSWDYKPGGKHPAEANQFYKIVVDGKEELPVGTKIARKGNSVVFDFPDGTNFTLDDWCSVSDSRVTDLINGQAYSTTDSAYVSAKDIDSGTCVIWGDAGQAGAVLGDGGVAPVTTTAAPPVGGDDHTAAAIIGGILGLGAIAALAHSGGGDGGDSGGDKQKPTIGTPDAVNEDFAPLAINATSIKANDDSGAGNVQIVSAKIKSATGFDFSDDDIDANDDVKIVNNGGEFTLELNDTGANKFGSVTTTIEVQDAAGNTTIQDVVFVVNPVNDAPVNQVTDPGVPITSSLEIVDRFLDRLILSVSDIDENSGPDNHKLGTVLLDTDDGTLSATQSGSAQLVATADNKHLTITGNQQDINLTLESVVWHNSTPVDTTTRDVHITMTSIDNEAGGLSRDVDVATLSLSGLLGGSVGGGAGGFFSTSMQSSSVASLIGNVQDPNAVSA